MLSQSDKKGGTLSDKGPDSREACLQSQGIGMLHVHLHAYMLCVCVHAHAYILYMDI